jgi:hypothetical protein
LFGGNGGLLKFIIGNPKYLKGFGGLGGPSGFEPLLPRFNGCQTKIMFTSMSISVCTLTSCLGVWGLDLKLIIIWADIVTNGALVTITINWALP